MWLSRLDLIAFGRFTNIRLSLGPGFHLVYGPNEAGKSTALRAIRQFLFGFDERTSDNFLHANSNLRMGGAICNESGLELEAIRRKTRKDSLRTVDETSSIETELWETFLCGIDESTFSHRYGIDYEQLVQGGHEIATGSGDLGEILFATGSGLMDLNAVRKRLDDEASELFKPQGKKQRLNMAIIEWQQQREQVTASLLSVPTWEEADRRRRDVQTRIDEITNQWTALTKEADLCQRLQKALPLVQERKLLQEQFASLRNVPQLPDDFGAQRQHAMLLLKQAETQEKTATESLRLAELESGSLEIPDALLDRAEELERLFTESGSYLKALADRPKLVIQLELHQKASEELSKALSRPSADLLNEEFSINRSQRTQIAQLGRQHAGLAQALQTVESRHVRVSAQLAETREKLPVMAECQPIDELRTAVQQARSEGDLETQLANLKEEISQLESEASLQIQQMDLGNGQIANIKTIQVPGIESIKQREKQFESNFAEKSLQRSRLTELEDEHQKLARKIGDLRQEFQVPTEADLEMVRNNRDSIWTSMRESLTSKKIPSASLFEKYQQSVVDADHLADRLRIEADRVAQLADYLASQQMNETRQHEISLRIAELDAARMDLEVRWREEWPNLGTNPASPRIMETWVAKREILLQNDRQLLRRRTEANSILDRINSRVLILNRLLNGDSSSSTSNSSIPSQIQSASKNSRQKLLFGWEPDSLALEDLGAEPANARSATTVCSLNELLRLAEQRIESEDAAEQARKETQETLLRLIAEESELRHQIQFAKEQLDQWQLVWNSEMSALKFAPDTSPDVAAADADILFDLADHRRQMKLQCEQIDLIDSDAKRFSLSIKTLCEQIAPDLLGTKAIDAANLLRMRLSKAQRDQIKLNELFERKKQSEQQLVSATESRTQGLMIVKKLCADAGFPETPNWRSAEDKCDRHPGSMGFSPCESGNSQESPTEDNAISSAVENVNDALAWEGEAPAVPRISNTQRLKGSAGAGSSHRLAIVQKRGAVLPKGDGLECREKNCETLLQTLSEIEEQSRLCATLEEKLDQVVNRLTELAGDQSIEEFLSEIASRTPDALRIRSEELSQEVNRIGKTRDQLNRELGGFDEQLSRMDGNAGAAEAEEKQRQSLAQIRSDAEQYIRIKLASSVLHSAIERYREKIRGPVLNAASELFRELTMGSFEGLRVEEVDQNRPVLVGLRSNGRQAIPVTGMSEGTCDQLYLALRLASLQLETAPRSHLPFIVDDILIQFDDQRSAAALRVLSRLAQQRQVIFFTHNQHLLDIASREMNCRHVAHRLDRQGV